MPRYLPEMYGWGNESEAIIYVGRFLEGWLANPAALAWLKSQLQVGRG
jgi:hypothetical protein